jgi:hypothetical protein
MNSRQCEYYLVRYIPDRVKNEFVNIGVLLREPAADTEPVVRFTRDWRRVRCIDPDADTASFEALEVELRASWKGEVEGTKPLLGILEDSFSNNLQLTPANGFLVENLLAGVDQLMSLYIEPRKRETVSRKSGRQAIYASMRDHFERVGVWDLMRKRIAASAYTRAGDPLRIDCGYRPNGVVRMFHAVSLEGDMEAAKVLAFSVAGLREGVKRVEQADLELTAIIEPVGDWNDKDAGKRAAKKTPDDSDRREQYEFARETMEKAEVRVLTTRDLSRVAETARLEMGA